MRILTLGAILALLPAALSAQCSTHERKLKNPFTWLKSNMCPEEYRVFAEPRQKDRFYKDKMFWIGIAVIAASHTLDAHSTAQGFGHGIPEANPILGPHPTNRRIALYTAGYFTFESLLHAAAWKESHNDPSKTWRLIGQWGLPAVAASVNGVQGVKNYRLEARLK